MEDGSIQDNQITASSVWGNITLRLTTYSRLNNQQESWIALFNDLNQWIQVDLGVSRLVSGIVMQGRADVGHWVRTYMVQYNRYGSSYSAWHFVKERNQMYDAVSMFVNTFHATN